MITTILPFVSCVCDASDFEAAQAQGFKEIYIKTLDGILKHHQLRGENRFIRLKVDKIPGYTEPAIVPAMNFLPDGKIPYNLFEQIEAFFRKVIQVRGTALEAMIFILWNREQGYHLFVPEQRVAAASVTFDPTSLPAGSSIVVNVHSHGHMSAFFSGTDDNNDKDLIQFSGVFGNFQNPVPSTIWRFNYYNVKFKAEVSDIFLSPAKEEMEVPNEWMDKVSQVSYATKYQGGKSGQGNAKWDHLKPYQYQKKQVVSPGSNSKNFADQRDTLEDRDLAFQGFDPDESSFGVPQFEPYTPPGVKWRYDPNKSAFSGSVEGSASEDEFNLDANEAFRRAMERDERGLSIVVEDTSTEEEAGAVRAGKLSETPSRGTDQKSLNLEESEENSHLQDLMAGDIALQYEALQARFGTDVADAWWGIDSEMSNLSGHDHLLMGLMSDMFNLLQEDKNKYNFFVEMFQNLPERYVNQVQTSGIS